MNASEIITSDKFCDLSHNYISKKKINIEINPDKNIFFIKTDCIDFFRSFVLPKITYKFSLITHESDCPVNEQHMDILNHPLLHTWFGMNCHILHAKLQPIPIGLANAEWPHGNKQAVEAVSSKIIEKTGLVYCNYDFTTNITERNKTYQLLKDKSFIHFDFNKHPFDRYLQILSSYRYVISPPGNSVDCHRVWESIYCKTIPICIKSLPMLYFKDLPILFINSWEDITEELLVQQYDCLKYRKTDKSHFSFYQNFISQSV